MTRVGVLGVGRMGLPIASRLDRAGFDVGVFDSDDGRLREARELSLGISPDAARLVERSEVLLTVLPDGDAVGAAMDSVLRLPRGALWIDLSSGDPRLSETHRGAAGERGIRCVSAPMSGGPAEASTGELGFFVSGAAADVAAALPVLAAIGRPASTVVVGDRVGDGQLVKLLANLLWFGQVIAATEALLLGSRLGLDLGGLRHALGESAGGSAFLDRHVDRLLAGDYLDAFGIDRCVVELRTITELAREAGTPAQLSELVAQLHEEALLRFGPVLGELLAARLLEERAGVTLRVTPS